MAPPSSQAEASIDSLYELPLDEFTKARDELARRLKAAGDSEGAAEVKGARKPTLPAWGANQVVRKAPAEWERLRKAAGELREKHGKRSSLEGLRDATRQMREALEACERRARDLLATHEHSPSPAVLQQVVATLLALAQGTPRATPGRLDRALKPAGFEALAGVPLPAVSSEKSAGERRTSRDRADDSRQATLKAAQIRHERAEEILQEARARLAREERRVEDLEKQLKAARGVRAQAQRELRSAESEVGAAETSLGRLRRRQDG